MIPMDYRIEVVSRVKVRIKDIRVGDYFELGGYIKLAISIEDGVLTYAYLSRYHRDSIPASSNKFVYKVEIKKTQ